LHTPSSQRTTTPHSTDWGAALGNAENAKLAVGALRETLGDAVFLDEEAFTSATTLQLYQQRITVRVAECVLVVVVVVVVVP